VAIFSAREGDRDLREAPLQASGYEQGNAELEQLDEEGLRRLLARSRPKEL
jgi:hypothetical protein